MRKLLILGLLIPMTLSLGITPTRAKQSVGSELWANRYNGSANHGDAARAIGVSPDGSTVFVTGGSAEAATLKDFTTIAYDASTGGEVWVQHYDGSDGRRDFASALDVAPNGSAVFVTGRSGRGGYATVAYDASTGAQLWASRYAGGNARPVAIAASPDGSKVFVAGSRSNPHERPSDYVTAAFDAHTGERVWRAHYGPGDSEASLWALAVSDAGSALFVTGYVYTPETGSHETTIAYDSTTGIRLWTHRGALGLGRDLSSSPDGSTLYVAGARDTPHRDNGHMLVVAIDATSGDKLWMRGYRGTGGHADWATAVVVSPDGSSLYVTGAAWSETRWVPATLALATSSGAALWTRRYIGVNPASAIAVDPRGTHVFVAGTILSTTGDSDLDWATLVYDAASGSIERVMRYDGSGEDDHVLTRDSVAGVVADPRGAAVYVVGSSVGASTGNDFATVAYDTTS